MILRNPKTNIEFDMAANSLAAGEAFYATLKADDPVEFHCPFWMMDQLIKKAQAYDESVKIAKDLGFEVPPLPGVPA